MSIERETIVVCVNDIAMNGRSVDLLKYFMSDNYLETKQDVVKIQYRKITVHYKKYQYFYMG